MQIILKLEIKIALLSENLTSSTKFKRINYIELLIFFFLFMQFRSLYIILIITIIIQILFHSIFFHFF